MRRVLTGTTAILLAQVSLARAQLAGGSIRLGLSLGTISFGGAAQPVEDRSDKLRAMPFRPTMWGITLSWRPERLRVGLAAAYGQPGLALRGNPAATPTQAGDGLLIVADNAFRLAAFSATLSPRLKPFTAGPALRPSLGLLLERWSSPGAPTQTLLGGQAGLALEVPLTRSLSGTVTGAVGFTPGSPFHDEVVPEGFKPRSTWRRTLAGGVVLRL